MSENKTNLLLFFDRPIEPCFMQKMAYNGKDKAIFFIPDHYFPERYKYNVTTITNRFGEDPGWMIPIRNIAIPDLSEPLKLGYNSNFSLYIPVHRAMAGKLIDIFMGMRNIEDLMALCTYCQMRINPYMFIYCLSVAILHRQDTKGMNIPTLTEIFPDKFMDPKVFRQCREVTNVSLPNSPRRPIIIPVNYTASDIEPEQRVAYFREDIGLNLHHWHWHLVYPSDAIDRNIVNKDRRGELFYYMHNQIVARYNAERLCNNLDYVNSYNDFSKPIEEAYFPKLNSVVASRSWPPRFAGTKIGDMERPVEQIKIEVSILSMWRDRIVQAIENNSVLLPNGRQMPLDEERGIDILGNMIEASNISPYRNYYGNIHNLGHIFISYAHDPDYRHLEMFGVIGDSATAMRDPMFYRWHSYIDDIFQLYKDKLTPYGNDKLGFPGISISSIAIEGAAGNNIFGTFWEESFVELDRGLDFMPRGSVLAKFKHLQHQEYNYVIEVNNTSGRSAMGTVRIFMAPTKGPDGQNLRFDEQRRLMIELDKFNTALKPGYNTVRRRSIDSSVTIPYERTFRSQNARPGDQGSAIAAEFDFCDCGWPHHMLIPKGTKQGHPVVLFAMISDWTQDKIDQDLLGFCSDASSYCGIRDRKYPDRRAMGFPFDRPAGSVATLHDFLRPNMNVRHCHIKFNDVTIPRGQKM